MRIVSLDTFLVPPRWLFLRVRTDEGITGWGEPAVEGRAETVRAAIAELSDHLIGADPLRIEHHWQVLTKGGFYRGGPVLSSAVAGIDQALWDITGKAYEQPVHALLGGAVRDRVRMYSWIGGDRPEDVAALAREQIDAGFTAVKMNGSGELTHIDTPRRTAEIVDRVAAVREAIGPDNHLAALAASTTVPLAAGERLYSRWDFRTLLTSGTAVAQPDVSHAGGISEVRRIAAMAEAHDVTIAPHCPLGPIALAASLQLAFTIPNFLIQEQSIGIHYHADNHLPDHLIDPTPFRFHNGHATLSTTPGLGININENAVIRAAQTGHRWRNPTWRHTDGSFAEW